MKNVLLVLPILSMFLIGCTNLPFSLNSKSQTMENQALLEPPNPAEEIADPASEDAGIRVVQDSLIPFTQDYLQKQLLKTQWSEESHDNYVYLCAIKLGLSPTRAAVMRDAAHMPDVFQSGLDNLYNQQWSHAYMIAKTFWGPQWMWGDADDDYHDNIDAPSAVFSGSEGYNAKWAGFYYQAGNLFMGDWYVGYACHYIADVCFVLHVSIPDYDMAVHHFDYEAWIANNWSKGHCFAATATAVPVSSYYKITDLRMALAAAARGANLSYSTNARLAWENYVKTAFPTAAGTGSSELVVYTRKMVEETVKWTGATILYAQHKYNAK